jgi:hypothetical protein
MKPGNRYSHSNTAVPIPAMETLIDERETLEIYEPLSFVKGVFNFISERTGGFL